MKRMSLIILIVVSTAVICLTGAATQTQRPVPQTTMTTAQRQQLALEKTTTTQQRLNRYFHSDVIPKLRNCWSRLLGKGTIEFEHSYRKDASGKWIADKLTASRSTLRRGQEAVALQCMRDAVRGTAFPVEGGDGNARGYTINWTWPVPFPTNSVELTSAMFASKPKGGGGGGCDGRGALAKCYICDNKTCVKVCVGYKTCKIYTTLNGTFCTESEDCASGGPFGVTGGSVIY